MPMMVGLGLDYLCTKWGKNGNVPLHTAGHDEAVARQKALIGV